MLEQLARRAVVDMARTRKMVHVPGHDRVVAKFSRANTPDDALKNARRRLHAALRAPPLESKLEGDAVAYAERFDCLHYKLNGAGRRGKGDRVFALPNGWTWWVEFKRKGEAARADQALVHRELRRRHQIVDVVDTIGKFKRRLHHLLAKHTGGGALL